MEIEELIEIIEMLKWQDGIETWSIGEDFENTIGYIITGLKLEIEQGIVLATDSHDEIYKAFLVESIKDIKHKDKAEFTINFSDGKINIKGLLIS